MGERTRRVNSNPNISTMTFITPSPSQALPLTKRGELPTPTKRGAISDMESSLSGGEDSPPIEKAPIEKTPIGKKAKGRPNIFQRFMKKMAAPKRPKSAEKLGGVVAAAAGPVTYEWLAKGVKEAPYFHGMIHKDEIGALCKKDGDFILRLGRSQQSVTNVTLSLMWAGKHRHFIITRGEKAVWVDEAHQFKDEVELVEWYTKTGAKMGMGEYELRNPVQRATWELEKKDVELRKEVGKGAFGKVYIGTLRSVDKGQERVMDVAIKLCDTTEESLDAQNTFMKEAEIGRRYTHPNVVKVYGVQCRERPMMIVMEYCPEGSLLLFVRREKSLGEKTLIEFCRDASHAMEFLAKVKVIHRDVAARNFLIGPGRTVKIADFGLAKADCIRYRMKTRVKLALKWLPPEVLILGDFSFASEVWMFGVTMWEVMGRGKVPFPGLKKADIKKRVCSPSERLHLECPGDWAAPVREAIAASFAFNPAERPDIAAVGALLDKALGRRPANPASTTLALPQHTTYEKLPLTHHRSPSARM